MCGKIKFTIYGDVPALKNSKIIITKPYPRLISNPRVAKWTENAHNRIRELKLDNLKIDCDIYLKAKLYFSDKRRRDCDNAIQTINDTLFTKKNSKTDNPINVILDDSQIKHLEVINMGVDKENPRVEVEIEKYVGNKRS